MQEKLLVKKRKVNKKEDYGFTTYDYDQFAFIKKNRSKYQNKNFRKLLNSIKKKGGMICPATVNTLENLGISGDDEKIGLWDEYGNWYKWDKPFPPKFIVIDGQHRLTVCKLENLPYKVYVNNDAQTNDIIDCNVITKGFDALQFAKYHHVEQSHPEATALYNYLTLWNGKFRINTIHKVFNGKVENIKVDFDPIINLDHSASLLLSSVYLLKDHLPAKLYKHEKLVFAFQDIYKNKPNFNMSWFIEGLKISRYGENRNNDFELFTRMEHNVNKIMDIYYKGQKFIQTINITPNDYLPIDSRNFNERQKLIVKQRANHECEYCGAKEELGAKLEIDHYIAISKGGKTEIENAVCSCQDCNRSKTDSSVEEKQYFNLKK